MTLMRWEPMVSDGLWIDRVFDNLLPARWRGEVGGLETVWWPRMDIVEEKDSYRMDLDLPGLRKDDIKLAVQNDHLEITGDRKYERREDENGYERLERSYGSFRRSFRLPEGVDSAKIESTYENGVLTVRIPKPKEAVPRQIEIKVR
jgi:HSP20 family protein